MGLHSYFQQKNIPFGSVMSKVWNKKIFKNIQDKVDLASKTLAEEGEHVQMLKSMELKKDFQTKQRLLQQHQFQLFVVVRHLELNQ